MMALGCQKADVQNIVCGTLKYNKTVIPIDIHLGAVSEPSSVLLVIALGFSADQE
jgi:hypothetical protein